MGIFDKNKVISLKEGIKHIEDLKPENLLKFLSHWNLDKENFLVTEKIDGNFLGFGLKDNAFYLRSKNKVFNSPEEVPNLFFMNDFRKYFLLLQKVPLAEIVSRLSSKYGFDFNGSISISGEAVPSYDHNIVIYDEKKIGDGIFVIFDTVINDQKFNNPNFWQDLASEVNKHTSIKVYAVPKIDLTKLKFDNDLVVSLESLIKKHGNFLKKPARTPEEKELKAKVLDKVKEIGKSAKQQVVQSKFKSLFGDEYEGIVVATPDGELVKIVEKDKFTKRKEGNWHFIDMLIKAQTEFKKAVKANPSSLKSSLVKWEKSLAAIEKDFRKNADNFITISKKKSDTDNSIDLDKKTIQKMKELLDSEAPEEVVDKYLSRNLKIDESANHSFLVKEGGGALTNTNSVVPKELLNANIKHALEKHGMGSIEYSTVGNVNKPFLGDIDIAVSKKQLIDNLDLSEGNFWEDLESFLSDSDTKIIKGLNQFHLQSELVDDSGKQISAVDKDGNSLNEPGLIQIDVFVGHLGWMKDVVSGSPVDSKYKAVYRNLFLSAAFSKIKWSSNKNPNVYNKLLVDPKEGFKLVQKEIGAKGKDKKLNDKVFSVNSDVVARVLFDKTTKWSDINSFEKLWTLFNSEKFRFKSLKRDILEEYKKTLEKAKKELPKELQ